MDPVVAWLPWLWLIPRMGAATTPGHCSKSWTGTGPSNDGRRQLQIMNAW